MVRCLESEASREAVLASVEQQVWTASFTAQPTQLPFRSRSGPEGCTYFCLDGPLHVQQEPLWRGWGPPYCSHKATVWDRKSGSLTLWLLHMTVWLAKQENVDSLRFKWLVTGFWVIFPECARINRGLWKCGLCSLFSFLLVLWFVCFHFFFMTHSRWWLHTPKPNTQRQSEKEGGPLLARSLHLEYGKAFHFLDSL